MIYPRFEDIHILTKNNNFLSKSQISRYMNVKDRKLKKNDEYIKKRLFLFVSGNIFQNLEKYILKRPHADVCGFFQNMLTQKFMSAKCLRIVYLRQFVHFKYSNYTSNKVSSFLSMLSATTIASSLSFYPSGKPHYLFLHVDLIGEVHIQYLNLAEL